MDNDILYIIYQDEDGSYQVNDDDQMLYDCGTLDEAVRWCIDVCRSLQNRYNTIEIKYDSFPVSA